MPFWVHGRDTTTGRPRDSLFVETDDETDARQQAAEAGMTVEEVEFVRAASESTSLTEDATNVEVPPADVPSEPRSEPAPKSPVPKSPRKVEMIRCARCNSDRVVPRASIWDQGQHSGGTLQAYVYSNPDAFVFKGTAYATLYARICADCGHTELFAAGAEGLYKAYRQSQTDAHGAQ